MVGVSRPCKNVSPTKINCPVGNLSLGFKSFIKNDISQNHCFKTPDSKYCDDGKIVTISGDLINLGEVVRVGTSMDHNKKTGQTRMCIDYDFFLYSGQTCKVGKLE